MCDTITRNFFFFSAILVFLLYFASRTLTRLLNVIHLLKQNFMEQLNRIEIRGVIGSLKLQTFSETVMARITVATNYAYKDKTGKAVIETNWHSIVAREGKYVKDLEKLKKGDKVYVQGRLRYQKISGDDGSERMFADIVANRLMVIDDPEPMSYEM